MCPDLKLYAFTGLSKFSFDLTDVALWPFYLLLSLYGHFQVSRMYSASVAPSMLYTLATPSSHACHWRLTLLQAGTPIESAGSPHSGFCQHSKDPHHGLRHLSYTSENSAILFPLSCQFILMTFVNIYSQAVQSAHCCSDLLQPPSAAYGCSQAAVAKLTGPAGCRRSAHFSTQLTLRPGCIGAVCLMSAPISQPWRSVTGLVSRLPSLCAA